MDVWCVFDADGYECKSLDRIYSDEQDANERAAFLRVVSDKEWARYKGKMGDNPQIISVEPWGVYPRAGDCK